jgi:Holliday junction resolvase RusA-like endonuclease
MTDSLAPARRLSAAEREQWWIENRDRTDELLHSPDPIPRIGGVDDAAVRPGWYFRDEHHKRPPVERAPVIDLRRTKPARASKNGRPKKGDGIEVRDGVVTVDGVRFGEWIRQKRIERGMSQRTVTYAVGLLARSDLSARSRVRRAGPEGHTARPQARPPIPRGIMIQFTVFGTAKPAGSKRAFRLKNSNRVVLTDANKNSKPWKAEVAQVAGRHVNGAGLLRDPLDVHFVFYVARPKGHFTSKGELSAKGQRESFPAKRPDVLKLARGVEDALTGVLYADDSQIVIERLEKRWGEPERVEITITEASEPPPLFYVQPADRLLS